MKLLRKKFNSCCSQRLQIAMNTFTDTFQGIFKDNYRGLPAVWASMVMFLAICIGSSNSINVSLVQVYALMLSIASFTVAFIRPCKSFLANVSLSFHFLWMAVICAILVIYMVDIGATNLYLPQILLCFVLFPHVLIFLWGSYCILHKTGFLKTLKVFTSNTAQQLTGKRVGSSEALLPHRLESPQPRHELGSSAGQVNYSTITSIN